MNGGFESESVSRGNYKIVASRQVPGWSAEPDQFEIWAQGKDGVSAAEGSNFIEMNVDSPTTIRQDFATTPGSRFTWSFFHRGRNGNDSVEVLIGPSFGPIRSTRTVRSGTRWREYSGSYEVPAGQTSTRIAFRALDSGSVGNFLDGVSVELEP